MITSNTLTEIVQRIPTTTILETYIKETTSISIDHIQTVQLTVSDSFIESTIVVKTEEGLKQYEFLVNIDTNVVK